MQINSFSQRRGVASALIAVLFTPCLAFADLSGVLEGRHFSSSTWNTGTIHSWKEREGVPCRIRFSEGPATDQVITIEFDHSEGPITLIEDINSYGHDHVVVKSGPTLSAPPSQDVWSYTMTVDVTSSSGELRFEARLAAGAHLADRSSFRVYVSGIGRLEIERPERATGTPDLVVVKTGPETARAGDVLNYRLECYNKAEAINAADGVQVFDRLPPEVTFLPGSANWPAVLVGNTLRFDLGDLQEGERELVTYQVRVNNGFSFNQEFSNFAQIYSSEDDGDFNDNTSSVRTTLARPPAVANDDSYEMAAGDVLDVPAPGVLANDTGPEDAVLLASLATEPGHGWLTFNSDGSFIYMPNQGFHGVDTFTYAVSDGGPSSAPATVTINVTAMNAAPVATNDAYAMDKDTALSVPAPGVLLNDTDPENDALSGTIVASVQHGTLQLNADGSFLYLPQPGFYGTDGFAYRAWDGANSSEIATVTITVRTINNPPTASDDSYSMDDSHPLVVSAPGVLANDADPEGSALQALLETAPSHGTLALRPDGSFIYTPALNFSGNDSFTYRATDGALLSGVATVRIAVTAVADPPVAVDDQYATDEDWMLTINAPGILGNDSDPDGDTLVPTVVSTTQHGVLTLRPDGSFVYVPRGHYYGQDSFTYRVSDGALQSGIATVTISIRSVNDRPVVNLDSYSTYKGRAITIAAPGLLSNDLDVDNDPLSALLVSGASHGSVTLSPNGAFTYTPNANYTGADSFIYKATDGMTDSVPSIVAITIRPVSNNIPPIVEIVRPTNATVFLSPADITVIVEATDLDGQLRNVEIFEGTNRLGQFTAAPYFVVHTNLPPGQYAFHARATDDDGASSTSRTVNVTVVDRLPLIETNPIHFNPQTGLFEVAARVTNPTLFPFDATRILVYNMPAGVRVRNVSGQTNGIPYVHSNLPLAPGGSIDFVIEFYTSTRVAPPCVLVPVPVLPVAQANPRGAPVPVRRVKQLPDHTMLIDFNGPLNRVIYVQYADQVGVWKTAVPHLIGTGTTMQWLDNGPPKTDSHPDDHPTRFYRVIALP